jgi:RNA polymerase sigma-70 factor, ECF subfamily
MDLPESPTILISDCLRGDDGACALLFDQYKGLVYRTAYLMLEQPQDAEDALQEVFTRVFRALHTYDAERGAFTTWLHRITVNVCLMRQRRSTPPDAELDDESGHTSAIQSSTDHDPFALLSRMDQAEHLLAVLDGDQRAVVVLRFYHDLPYTEIAEIMGTALGTVQSRLGRALKKMRGVMQTMAEEEGHSS